MIEPYTYSGGFYNSVMPPAAAALKNAADAADFVRILNAPASSKTAPPAKTEEHPFLSFLKGIVDVINPLQHIPVISTIYRHITGDEISPAARLAGDALYGGPVGAALSLADITFQKTTGKDIGETVMAALTPGREKNADDAKIAQNLNNNISSASDDQKISSIVWSTPAIDSPLSLTPARLRYHGTNGDEPAEHSTPTPAPVLYAKDNVITALQPPTASKVDPSTVLHPQEAPAATSRTDVPPDLIAAKMMEALDKYRQMHSTSVVSTMSEIY